MIDWWHDLKLAAAIGGGLFVGLLLSTGTTWKNKVTQLVCGLFFALILTRPVIHQLGLDFSQWEFGVAGLLAMSGDRLARRALQYWDAFVFFRVKP